MHQSEVYEEPFFFKLNNKVLIVEYITAEKAFLFFDHWDYLYGENSPLKKNISKDEKEHLFKQRFKKIIVLILVLFKGQLTYEEVSEEKAYLILQEIVKYLAVPMPEVKRQYSLKTPDWWEYEHSLNSMSTAMKKTIHEIFQLPWRKYNIQLLVNGLPRSEEEKEAIRKQARKSGSKTGISAEQHKKDWGLSSRINDKDVIESLLEDFKKKNAQSKAINRGGGGERKS